MTWESEVQADGPMIWHRFQDSLANSGSGQVISGTSSGVNYQDGAVDRGFYLSDTSSYIEYPLTENLFTGQWTVEGWFKSNHTKFYNNIIRMMPNNGRHLGIRVRGSSHGTGARPNTVECFTYDGVSWGDVRCDTVNVNRGDWHYFAVKATGINISKNLTLFVDGNWYTAGAATNTRGIDSTGNSLRIGSGPDPGGVEAFTTGLIDEVAIYNKALSDARIWSHYVAGQESGPGSEAAQFRGWGIPL